MFQESFVTLFQGSDANDHLPPAGANTAGNDQIYGYGGNDVLDGGAGNDLLVGGAGADTLTGGVGIDTAGYVGDAPVSINLTTGHGYGGEAQGDVLTGIDNLSGTGFNDLLIGSAGSNVLSGNGGADVLSGMAGNDTLNGGDGNDALNGGDGADTLNGGAGVDLVTFGGAAAITVTIGGIGHGGQAEGDHIGADIENVNGTPGNDSITGSAADNLLRGDAGNDVLNGLVGNDTLVGEAGADTLSGGAGADHFVFDALGDSTTAAPDRITDFSHAQGDKIDLHLIDANTAVAGDQAFTFIGTHAFTGHAGELSENISGGVTVIGGDVNGDGHSDFHIVLTGSIALSAADFVL
jgi:Ca2+-binding RTX toxin-like protein